MLALALALCNADRVVISVAIVPLSLSNSWSRSFAGIVQAETIRETIDDVGFEAILVIDEGNEKYTLVCRIRIKGMTCTSCSSTVESTLQAVHGVQKAQVALATEEADNQLMVAIEDTGFEAILINSREDMSKIDLQVDGVWTDHSMKILEQSLQALPGVQCVDINHDDRKISLSY